MHDRGSSTEGTGHVIAIVQSSIDVVRTMRTTDTNGPIFAKKHDLNKINYLLSYRTFPFNYAYSI